MTEEKQIQIAELRKDIAELSKDFKEVEQAYNATKKRLRNQLKTMIELQNTINVYQQEIDALNGKMTTINFWNIEYFSNVIL